MRFRFRFICLCILFIYGCQSTSPRIAVDPSSITDQEEYNKAYDHCHNLAMTIDLNDEQSAKTLAGAATGAVVVGGVATAVAGAIFAPAIPFIIAGAAAGGGVMGDSVAKEEKNAREAVLIDCLSNKGYKVYGARGL